MKSFSKFQSTFQTGVSRWQLEVRFYQGVLAHQFADFTLAITQILTICKSGMSISNHFFKQSDNMPQRKVVVSDTAEKLMRELAWEPTWSWILDWNQRSTR